MDGFEGREYAIELTVLNAIVRVVLVKNRRIALMAISDSAVDGNADVRRFLDSLNSCPNVPTVECAAFLPGPARRGGHA